MTLHGGRCPRAEAGLAMLSAPAAPVAHCDGADCSLDEAVAAAVARLAASRQPLFAPLAADVAGLRALYPLASAVGAVCDGEPAAVPLLRSLQDRGQFTATLSEVRTRAEVIVFVGGLPLDEAPLIGTRCGIGQADGPLREVVVLGPAPGDEAVLAGWAGERAATHVLPLADGDLLRTLSLLALPTPPAPYDTLIARLRAAHYSVFVGSAARLGPQGALAVEAVGGLVGQLNASTRSAALWIGASGTAQQTFSWLSGYPLRTRVGTSTLEHEPLLHDGRRLLDAGEADLLLWVSAFGAPPPAVNVPTVVLGPPALAASCRRAGAVFIAVATPGIGSAGHLARTDGVVMMPLHAVRDDGLPGIAGVAERLLAALQARRAG